MVSVGRVAVEGCVDVLQLETMLRSMVSAGARGRIDVCGLHCCQRP